MISKIIAINIVKLFFPLSDEGTAEGWMLLEGVSVVSCASELKLIKVHSARKNTNLWLSMVQKCMFEFDGRNYFMRYWSALIWFEQSRDFSSYMCVRLKDQPPQPLLALQLDDRASYRVSQIKFENCGGRL